MSSRWGEVYNIYPSLLDWLLGPHHRIFRNFAELWVFISEQIQRHQQTRHPGEPRDFIHCFLDQMDKGTFVIPLLVSAHRDPTQFKDPDFFNPTNF
ncbi:cytochrome P450 2F2-like isoform X4 [Nycticebus coucang]|uniref:cytochrome P450 2F2-like isoform X4 n=1 Tax=Nycticebus coucang TaxID=9470 RepID=UPI00234C874F|nr:cytochrome P450 2F2-like isoform X4 [Nycticebus coucang]